jgi:hypothetical protein
VVEATKYRTAIKRAALESAETLSVPNKRATNAEQDIDKRKNNNRRTTPKLFSGASIAGVFYHRYHLAVFLFSHC